MLPRLSPPQHHLARRGWGLRSKCPTPRPKPAEADCSHVPPDLCSRRLRSPPAIIPSPPLAPAHLKRQFCSLVQELDFHLSALTRQTGTPAPASRPASPPAVASPSTPGSTSSRLLPSRRRDALRSRRHARPKAASGSGTSAHVPRGCPAPPLARLRLLLALIFLPKSHLK